MVVSLIYVSLHVSRPLAANRQEFLVSCLWGQFLFRVDVLDVQANVLLSGLEQFRHEKLLCEPDGFVLETDVDFYGAIFRLVDQEPGLPGQTAHALSPLTISPNNPSVSLSSARISARISSGERSGCGL